MLCTRIKYPRKTAFGTFFNSFNFWMLWNFLAEKSYISFTNSTRFGESLSPPPGGLLVTDRSEAVVLVLFLQNVLEWVFRVVIYILFVVYLYVNGSGSITSVGKRELICLLLIPVIM